MYSTSQWMEKKKKKKEIGPGKVSRLKRNTLAVTFKVPIGRKHRTLNYESKRFGRNG